MRSQKTQLILIALGMLIFWSFQLTHAQANHFPQKTPYQVCFSPKGQCENIILHLINNAKHSIHIQSYSFTSRKIA